jgi:ankyrin repeat protein
MLSASPKSNASILFHLLSSVAPKFPVNLPDDDGYTPLLLAYIAGNSSLCESLVGAGAHPGMCTKQKLSIFNAPVATKQLLFRILEQLQVEPTWLDGQNCMNCDIKFNISHRKHHCRHCGRLLCNKCTSQQMPIVKFDLNKPVRVCEICGDSFRLSSDY